MSGMRVAFTGGEWNRMGAIRYDVDGYGRSAQTIVNFLVHTFGGLMRRPGAERMCAVDGGAACGRVRLMGMDVSDERRYMVVFGAGFVEVFRLDGSLAARLESPWTEQDLPELRWVQCNDVVWVVCGRVAPQRLERHGDDDWRLAVMEFDRSPREFAISKDGEAWVERDAGGLMFGADRHVFRSEEFGTSLLYTQHMAERVVVVQTHAELTGTGNPPKAVPDLSAAGTIVLAGQELWTVSGDVRVTWTCYKQYYGRKDYKGSKSLADYPEFFFPGWVVSRFGSGFNSMQEWWASSDGPQRAFICHEGAWTLKTYGNEDQRWQGEFQLMGADAEDESLSPHKFEVLHRFWSWDGDWRNFEFSGTCERPTRLQLRVMKYKPAATNWGRHELRLNAWDYEAEGLVAGVGDYGEEVWGTVLELDGGRLLLAGKAHACCYVFDRVDGGGRKVGEERDDGCGWVGGCVLKDGRAFLTSGGARCCVLDVESGEESEVLLEGVGDGFFGEAVLLDDGRVLLTPYMATAFYVYDPADGCLEKVAHSGLAVTSGSYRRAAVVDGGRVLLCPCKNGVACAVYDPVAQSLTACTVTGSKKAVWHVMPLRDGRAVLLCGESAGDVADGEAAMGSVCLYEDGKVVEKMGSFLGLAGCVEREDGRVVLLYFGLGGWGEFVWDLEDGTTIESKATVNGFWPRKWKWCGWRSGGMDMVNFLSGAVGRGVVQVWTAAEMGGMKWRVLRLSYKTYGGAGLPYERAVTDVWSRGMVGGGCGWPSAVAMHQGRLWLAGTAANPQTVWGSVVDDFANFQIGDSDEDAIQVTLAAKDCHRIVWMESVNDLLIGSTAQVWRLSGGEGGVVTPDFCRAAVQLRVGCSRVDAEATDGGCVFVQRGGMRVKELGYSFEADGYRAADTTTFAEHAGGPGGFVGLAVQRVPEVRIWGVRADGGLAVLTYNAEQRVCAWTRHVLGGGGRALSVAVMDGQDADEVWLAVERDGRVSLERLVEGCGVFRDGWSRGGDAGVPYESVLVTNGLAFEQGAGVKSGSVSVRARFVASAADGVRAGFCGRLTELSRSRGDVLDGWQDLTVPGVWSDELVFELRCAGDGDVRLLGFDVQFSK